MAGQKHLFGEQVGCCVQLCVLFDGFVAEQTHPVVLMEVNSGDVPPSRVLRTGGIH